MDLAREGDAGELDMEDPQLEEKLVNELKAQGVFDQFRKDCLSDVDTKPAYQNLRVRVDKSVSSYLSKTTWRPTLNKNQLRNQLRKYIQEMSGVEAGVDRIVDQIVNPKLNTTFMPEVENVIYRYFGTSKPEEGEDLVNGNNIDDENSPNLQNGDSNHDMGGKISTRNLSTISSNADEMLNFDANSVGSSPGPGLAGNVSPLTPGGSPKVNQGDISPLTPSTTPPPPPGSNTQPQNMELSQSYEEPPPMQMETPPPPPPGEELKIEEIVTMEVDTEENSRPQSAYTPPLPPTNNTHHSTPEKSYTPPLPMMIPPRPPIHHPSGPPSPHTPPLPPLPKEMMGEDSGGEASMSSISDTDLGDISPPRHRKQSGKAGSDVSEDELRLESEAGEASKNRDSDNVTPDKDTGSDEDLQQLEKMKAELMAQLEGDFKLSPEESDSEGDVEEGEDQAVKDSPTSPDHSVSSRSETPAVKQPSPSSTNSSPNQLQRVRNLPLPSPDYSTMTPGQRIKALPLPGEMSAERFRSLSGPGVPEDIARGPSSPDTLISGPRTPPMPMSRTPSQSPSPPPRKGPQTPPSPPSAFSAASRPYPPSTPPQESLSKLDLNDPQTVSLSCKPFSLEGPKSPPGPDKDQGGFGGTGGSAPDPQAPVTGGASSSHDGSKKGTAPTEGSDQKTPANKSSHSHSSSRSHHSSKYHSSSKDRKPEKKLHKIKEQTKAKIEKYEQKIKSKDKLKSDKFLDMDIFSTTKKPATPYQPHRNSKLSTSGTSTPVTIKPQRDFEKKLEESIKKEVQRREEEKEKRRKEEEKNNSFKMPVKIEDRRRSSSGGEKIKERRSSKDEKDSRSKDRHEKDRKDRKSSTDKERRKSEDDRKDSKYEKEREKQAIESKKRLQEAREKKEKEEKERKRVKDKEKRDKEKKIKDLERERESRKEKEVEKPKDRSKTKDILKEKIGALGIDNIQKMLMESLAEKTGAKFSEDEKKEMIKKLEGLISKKKDAKQSPKKIASYDSSEDDKPVKKISPKKNRIEDSSDSSSSDADSDSDGDQRIKELKNRIRERRKSGESDKSGEQSPRRTRPVRNKIVKQIQVETEHSDTDGDFVIKEEILEKAPAKELIKSIATPVKGKAKAVKIVPKVEFKDTPTPVKVEPKVEPKVKKNPVKKSNTKVQPVTKKADIDPDMEDLSSFSQSDVDFMLSIKEKYDSLLQDEDALSVSSITSEELNAAIPPTRTVVIDAGPDPEETIRIMKQFGGNPQIFTPVPEWLHPYLIGAKVKLEDVGMPTKQEISDYIQNKQTKSKKRGAGWDIVVEWVPTAAPPAKKSKLEKELGFDVDSSFGQTVALSGGKRTRRANTKYSEAEFSGEEIPVDKAGVDPNTTMAAEASTMEVAEQDQPNPAPVQPSNTVRTHLGSAQTPKRGGKGRKESLAARRVEPQKEEEMDIDTSEVKEVEEMKDSPESPPAAEDRAEVVCTAEDKCSPVISEDNPPTSEDSPSKKRRSKDIIAAYLTSAGVERVEEKHDVVEEVNHVDISNGSIVTLSDTSDDKEAVVAMLDAKISAADEELNSVLRNLKRKRSSSGDSKFHGWASLPTVVPRTGFSIMLEAAGADLAQLEIAGASFGMTDIDLLMSSEDEEGLLEVVMSQPIQRDLKKVESVPSVVGVTPIGDSGLKEGPKGKQSDSDSDERGALSPSSFGSTKENVPEIYNSVPSKFNQKSPSMKRKLKNPVLKTSVKVS